MKNLDTFLKTNHPQMCEGDIILLCQWVENFERFPNRIHPILWIKGKGKSTLLNLLLCDKSFMKYCYLDTESLKRQFRLNNFVGRDLALVEDCKSATFPSEVLVHQLLRGDYHEIQVPFEAPFRAYLKLAIIVLSNLDPEVSPEKILVIDLGE